MTMKKMFCLILALTMVLALTACGAKTSTDSAVAPQGTPEEIIEKIYAAHKEIDLSLMTMPADLQDAGFVSNHLGLSSADRIQEAALSEAMIGSQAYSMVVCRVKDAADAQQLAKDFYNNIKTNKWICVEADTKTAAYCGDVVMFFMVDSAFADTVTTESVGQAFNAVCGGGASFIG